MSHRHEACMSHMIQQGARDVHDPLLGLDIKRLENEMESYQEWLDQRADEAYQIATEARAKGLDHTLEVEIPRASDLASRTEKFVSYWLSMIVKLHLSKWRPWLQKDSEMTVTICRKVSMSD